MNNICLFGASGHGKVVKDVALSQNKNVKAFFDDAPKTDFLDETPVFSANKIENYIENSFLISIGNNRIRKEISKKINTKFATLIHKTTIIAPNVLISEGTVVMGGTIINAGTKIGKHTIINTASVVEHDCRIADFVHISPNATITGNVSINEGTHIGSGAVVIPNIKIGKWVTIGAGAVIISDVPDFAVVVGNPSKIIKYNKG